jgi:aminoglycoside 2'-N-acetyltransferase I
VRTVPAKQPSCSDPAHQQRLKTRVFTTSEARGDLLSKIRQLLDQAFEGHFSQDDWEHTLGAWHVVIMEAGDPVSHAAVVPRVLEVAGRPFRTGYVEGVATSPNRQREGLASLAMTQVAPIIRERFQIGALSTGHYGLFERLGWEQWRGPTFVRNGRQLIRTEDDDDALMVLRFGPSLSLDLAAPISCEARPGDDW